MNTKNDSVATETASPKVIESRPGAAVKARSCETCGSMICDGRMATCLGCGDSRCFAEGSGNGRCKGCGYGILPGWSGSDRSCGYKGCTERAAFAGVPGAIKSVCLKCSDRPKVTTYRQGEPHAIKVTLRAYIVQRTPNSPRALEWRDAITSQPTNVQAKPRSDGAPILYRMRQITESGIWTSEETFEARDMVEVARAVRAGYLIGWARWAERPDGTILWGIDPQGNLQTPITNLESIRG